MDRRLASQQNGVWGTSGDLELVYNEVVLSWEREPGIYTSRMAERLDKVLGCAQLLLR